jgi:hypothetical protein
MSKPLVCPQCSQIDQVEKVSTIYILGIEKTGQPRNTALRVADSSAPSQSALLEAMSGDELQVLCRRLAPPATKKDTGLRLIHPDLVVLAFSLVAPIFIYGILTGQPGNLPLVLLLLSGFYVFYFWQRRGLISKFQVQQDTRRAAEARIKRGLQHWMNLYYCARDEGVFEPGSTRLTPLDQIAGYLLKE